MSDVANLISSVGFPIGMCVILALYVKYLTDNFIKSIESNTKLLTEIKTILASSHLEGKGGEEKN